MGYKVLEPIKVGNVQLRNRTVYLAVAKYVGTPDNFVNDVLYEHYRTVAKGGVGLLIPGAMIIDPDWGYAFANQPGLYDDKFIPGLTKLAQIVHDEGAKIFFQAWHPGEVTNQPTIITKNVTGLTKEDIKDLHNKYVGAAVRSKAAGADGIEFQICHTYLSSQFFSPYFNKRTDEYGAQTVENSLRFALEAIAKMQEAVGPDFPIAVKINGSDFVPGGITPERTVIAAPILEAAGVVMLTVNAGGSNTKLTGMSADGYEAEGWKVYMARMVKDQVSIPVCASGNIRSPEFVEQILQAGDCDLVGIGRGFMAEPNWANKLKEGREDELRYCVSCLNCFNAPLPAGETRCSVNPTCFIEFSSEELNVDGAGKVVGIVGGGPGGLEAAVTLAQRGFKPVVFEASEDIGGAMWLASIPDGKSKLLWQMDYYRRMIKKLGVEVRLNAKATAESIKALNPYAVIIATGSEEISLKVPGSDLPHVHQVRDILENMPDVKNKSIVVVGSGLTGMETATTFKHRGNSVTIIDMLPATPPKPTARDYMLVVGHATAANVNIKMGHKLLEITEKSVIVENVETGKKLVFPADMVIVSVGAKSYDAVYESMKGVCDKVFNIGDSQKIGKILNAVQAGYKTAASL